MVDVSMCPSETCPSRRSCRRNEASGTKASTLQWWMDFDAERAERDRCTSYWPKPGGSDAGGEGRE